MYSNYGLSLLYSGVLAISPKRYFKMMFLHQVSLCMCNKLLKQSNSWEIYSLPRYVKRKTNLSTI